MGKIVWIIDDDDSIREILVDAITELIPSAKIIESPEITFANIPVRVDVIIIDVSSVCPMMMDTHHAYASICSLLERLPMAKVLINSALGVNAINDIVEDVQERMPDVDIKAVGVYGVDYMEKVERWIVPEITED